MTVESGRLAATIATAMILALCIVGEHLFSRSCHGRRWSDWAFSAYAVACLVYLAVT